MQKFPMKIAKGEGIPAVWRIEGVGRFYSKIFQDRSPEYWVVDKDGAVRHIERKDVDVLVLSGFDPSEKKDIMAYLNTGKWYCW